MAVAHWIFVRCATCNKRMRIPKSPKAGLMPSFCSYECSAIANPPKPKQVPTTEPRNIPLLDVTSSLCSFPTTKDRPFLFCGCPKRDYLIPYCDAHMAACYTPAKRISVPTLDN